MKIIKLILIIFSVLFINYDKNKYADYYIPIGELCLIKSTAGFPCPSCGMTRAHIEALRFNFKKAFDYHPLFIFPSIIFFTVIFRNKFRAAEYLYNNKYINTVFLFIFIIVYIIRFILLFPHKEPFTYNYNSNIYFIFNNIINIIK